MNSMILLFGKLFMERISPEIIKIMEDFVKDLHNKAKDTPNPVDNILVGILASVLKIELKG